MQKFREKSAQRMQSLLNEEVTVLFVSHSIGQVRSVCDSAIWLEHGKLIMEGDVKEVCDAYEDWVDSNLDVISPKDIPAPRGIS